MSGKSIFQIAMSDFHSSNTTEKLILLGLVSHADPDGGNAFPSKAKLAHYAGCNPKTVQRALKRLRDSGSITQVESDRRDKAITASRRPTAYRINSERFAHFASWEKEQGGHPDDPPSNSQTDSESQKVGGHPDVPSRGDTQMSPDLTGYLSGSNNLSSPPLSLRSHDDGATSFTEAQSARGAEEEEENDDQSREGEGDSTSVTDNPARPVDLSKRKTITDDVPDYLAPRGEVRGYRLCADGTVIMPPQDVTSGPASITADSVPLSGHDVSSEQARGPSSEAHSSSGSNHPSSGAESATGEHTAPEKVEYQDVDQKRAKHGWRPPEPAYEHARAIAPDVNTELVITDYWLWCHKKGIEPDASHWMKWITREQKRYEDAVREQERKQAVEERRNRSWARKNGWDL